MKDVVDNEFVEADSELIEFSPVPPPFVQTDEQRARWHVCLAAAVTIAQKTGADATFVFSTTRELFHSDLPTGSPDEVAPEHRAALGEPYKP
jgi:hypothetical protein